MSQKKFSAFGLLPAIERAIAESGYSEPTPIQEKSIPILMSGKDLLGCAQTGTGKTAAFALPILHQLAQQKRHLERRQARVLILTPTRELAVQIHESFASYGKYLRLRTAVVFGGVSQNVQVRSLSTGVDILVATPGRLQDLIKQRHIDLSRVEVLVLDEADRMLDMGFINDIRRIVALVPAQRHTLLFSATMPDEIRSLAASLLRDPVRVDVQPTVTTAKKIAQSVMFVERNNKRHLLRHVLNDKEVSRAIVFARTKHGANRIVDLLADNGISSDAIHGNKTQGARQRALGAFRVGRIRVLVATDIMARGIDIDDVTHVINYDIPNESESYVHRIGRTGRAGATGVAISFCDAEERGFLRNIEKLVGHPIPITLEQPYHSESAATSRSTAATSAYRRGGSLEGGGRNRRRGGGGRNRSHGGGGAGRRSGSPASRNNTGRGSRG